LGEAETMGDVSLGTSSLATPGFASGFGAEKSFSTLGAADGGGAAGTGVGVTVTAAIPVVRSVAASVAAVEAGGFADEIVDKITRLVHSG
jgi:uncharacterized spore protein YtfJ